MREMILVTGGTGFIGKALTAQLVESGHPVRLLLRPAPRTPDLPRGVPVEAAICSLNDERGLRAALVGVDTIYHLAGVERRGAYANLLDVDIKGTQAIAQAARLAGVERFIYLSHLGADRASAYPVMKAKAIAEEQIRRSGVDYTIIRSAIVYGENDGFTTGLARLLHGLPFIFLLPGDGQVLLQPLWVKDLAACLAWTIDDDDTRNQLYEVGGPEYLSLQQVVELVMSVTGAQRSLVNVRPPYLRGVTVTLESLFPGSPVSVYWLDYLATNRTCSIDTLPRAFKLLPARMNQQLDYLRRKDWRRELLSGLFNRQRAASGRKTT